MRDTIRLDTDELIAISTDLSRLVGEMDDVCGVLKLAQYRIPDCLEDRFHVDFLQLRRQMALVSERMEQMVLDLKRTAEYVASCEHAVKKRFDALETGYGQWKQADLPLKSGEKYVYSPFTPKKAHFVRMTVLERDNQI